MDPLPTVCAVVLSIVLVRFIGTLADARRMRR